jgi:putative protein-disulfide isomerase
VSHFEQITTAPGTQREGSEPGEQKAPLFIEYYTDPLCSWSWAFEAQWRRLRYDYPGQLDWRYRMGGMLPDWGSYADPLNEIHRPAQMGPQWFQVHELSGMPLDPRLWQTDAPDSSYPACLAVKAAERQGQQCAESYLRRLREAALLECRNIARQEVLFACAEEVAGSSSSHSFEFTRFCADYEDPATLETLRQDLRDAAYAGIGRFPTLILHHRAGQSIILVGYRPYPLLRATLEHLAPGLPRRPETLPAEDRALAYLAHWGSLTAREVAEIIDTDTAQAEELLGSLLSRRKITSIESKHSATHLYARS